MQTLRNNNAMLTTALEESTQHVAEWKRQLQKYKEECDNLRKKVKLCFVLSSLTNNNY